MILRAAFAVTVHDGESVLRFGMSLRRSQFKQSPPHCNHFWVGVIHEHAAEGRLRASVALPAVFLHRHLDMILAAGPRDSGTQFHKHTDAWNVLLSGRKRWFLQVTFPYLNAHFSILYSAYNAQCPDRAARRCRSRRSRLRSSPLTFTRRPCFPTWRRRTGRFSASSAQASCCTCRRAGTSKTVIPFSVSRAFRLANLESIAAQRHGEPEPVHRRRRAEFERRSG